MVILGRMQSSGNFFPNKAEHVSEIAKHLCQFFYAIRLHTYLFDLCMEMSFFMFPLLVVDTETVFASVNF